MGVIFVKVFSALGTTFAWFENRHSELVLG